jgi:hypothetical protein
MKLSKNSLLEALDAVAAGLATKEMIEQSTCFVFKNGRVITYNDKVSVSHPYDCGIEGAIISTEFRSFISKTSSDEIDLSIVGNEIVLKSGRSKAGITMQATISLPIEEIGEISKWKPLPATFLKGLSFAAGSCSRDLTRPVLNCVHVNGTTIEGTDSYRILRYTLESEMPLRNAILIQANICGSIVHMKPVQIAEGKGWVHFKNEAGTVLSCRLFEAKYVNTAPLLIVEGEEIHFPKELPTILDRAGTFAKRDIPLDEVVSIQLQNNMMVVSSKSASGWFTEKSKITYAELPIEFQVSPYLLKDILLETNVGNVSKNKLVFTGANWIYLTMLKA